MGFISAWLLRQKAQDTLRDAMVSVLPAYCDSPERAEIAAEKVLDELNRRKYDLVKVVDDE